MQMEAGVFVAQPEGTQLLATLECANIYFRNPGAKDHFLQILTTNKSVCLNFNNCIGNHHRFQFCTLAKRMISDDFQTLVQFQVRQVPTIEKCTV